MIVAKVISGAQTGADVAALRAAKSRGVPTGGTMPLGYKTLDGPKPEWAREFGLAQHDSPAWDRRTWKNVADADVTVRVAVSFSSPGERCTARACAAYKKPMVDVVLRRAWSGSPTAGPPAIEVVSFLPAVAAEVDVLARRLGRPLVVNAAGNSESSAYGITSVVERVWCALLDQLNVVGAVDVVPGG